MKTTDFSGIRIISNPYVPENTIFVNPKDFLLFKDPEKWQELQQKADEDLIKVFEGLSLGLTKE